MSKESKVATGVMQHLGPMFARTETARTNAWRQVERMLRFGTGSRAEVLEALRAAVEEWRAVEATAAAMLPKEPVKVPKEKVKEVTAVD